MSRREAVALEWCALAKCRFQCDKGKLVLEIGAWQCNSALRIHPILTWIRILGSNYGIVDPDPRIHLSGIEDSD